VRGGPIYRVREKRADRRWLWQKRVAGQRGRAPVSSCTLSVVFHFVRGKKSPPLCSRCFPDDDGLLTLLGTDDAVAATVTGVAYLLCLELARVRCLIMMVMWFPSTSEIVT
jgi:hypothetical protein